MAKALKPSQHRAAKLKISKLYLQGMTQSEIAATVNLNQSTISRLLDELSQDWLVEGVYNFNEAKQDQLHKINALEVTYWDAWNRSIGIKKEYIVTDKILMSQGGPIPAEDKRVKTWKEVGATQYLDGIKWCIEQRCKILGLYAPTKQDISGNVATASTFAEWIKIETERNKK
jgi:hypothetical protein